MRVLYILAALTLLSLAVAAAPQTLQPLWDAGANATRMFLSAPAVSGNRVFAASCEMDLAMTVGTVFCFSATDGKALWTATAADGRPFKGFFSSPAVTPDGKYVAIGEGLHMDGNARLICLDAATGAVRWAVNAPNNHFESSPAILGDMVVCGAGAIETDDGVPPDDPGFVIAVRIADGAVLWRAPVNDPESSPAIAADGTVYIGSGINGCAVVALRSGTDEELRARGLSRELWRTPVAHPATGAVTLDGDRVFVGIGRGDYIRPSSEPAGAVVCLDRDSGQKLWQAELGDAVLGTVAVRNNVAYAPVRNGELVALRVADGTVLWRSRLSNEAALLTGPTVCDASVYAVTNDGWLHLLNATDGTAVAQCMLNAEDDPGMQGLCLSSPLVAGGRLYVGSETGGLRALAVGK